MPSLSQTYAIQALIEADRRYWAAKMAGLPCGPDDRGVEIWMHGLIHHSTAKSLVSHGLAEFGPGEGRSAYLYLGRVAPYDAPP
jgi:hypothetical protein